MSEGHTFRWSRDTSYVSLTNISAASHEVLLWLSDGGRPAAAGPTDVTVSLDDRTLGTVQVKPGFKLYSFAIPPELAKQAAADGRTVPLKISTTSWNPEEGTWHTRFAPARGHGRSRGGKIGRIRESVLTRLERSQRTPRLQIYDRRERALVGAADIAFGVFAAVTRPFKRRSPPAAPRRILLLRLERIGDLIMALPAIQDVRALAPSAEIDLVVGGWNASLARAIPAVTRVETLDAEWLSREGEGLDLTALVRAGRGWRGRSYDLAINFEPDVRSNLLVSTSGAGWTGGWSSGGGGALLDVALEYDPQVHTTLNAQRLVRTVFGQSAPDSTNPLLTIPDSAARAAVARLGGGSGPIVGIHPSGGRAIKQWDTDRFAHVASRLVNERRARILLTGGPSDRPLVDCVKAELPSRSVVDVSDENDLLVLAALIGQLDLFITGDTGPMHLAAAVGTPVVAVFGPSDPARYAPPGAANRIVRVDLPCSPCNRIRRPPARCVGHTPDCLTSVSADAVTAAAISALDEIAANRIRSSRDPSPAST